VEMVPSNYPFMVVFESFYPGGCHPASQPNTSAENLRKYFLQLQLVQNRCQPKVSTSRVTRFRLFSQSSKEHAQRTKVVIDVEGWYANF